MENPHARKTAPRPIPTEPRERRTVSGVSRIDLPDDPASSTRLVAKFDLASRRVPTLEEEPPPSSKELTATAKMSVSESVRLLHAAVPTPALAFTPTEIPIHVEELFVPTAVAPAPVAAVLAPPPAPSFWEPRVLLAALVAGALFGLTVGFTIYLAVAR